MQFSFVDLFAGIGGFHAVLGALGGEAVLAAEIDPAPAQVYERNWGLRPERDVVDLAAAPRRRVPPHDVLAAGFPCQPFSKSGRQLGMAERRGQLFHEVLKILRAHQPPVVVLENVRNIAGTRQRDTWRTIVDGLRDAGYRIPSAPCVFSPHLLPPHLGGTPQIRDRVYILGTHVGAARAKRETDVLPVVSRRAVGDWDPKRWDLERNLLLDDSEIRDIGRYRVTVEEREWLRVWNDFLRRLGPEVLPGFPLWSTYWRDGIAVDSNAPEWKQDFERKNIAFYRQHRHVIREWLRANPELRQFPRSRQKLEWQAQDTPRNLYACLLHFRPSGIRAKKLTYAPALVAMAQTPVVGPRDRRLTPTEAARLQGFPDWFQLGDQAPSLIYKQLGNSISIGAAYHVIRQHVLRDSDDIAAAGGSTLVEAVVSSPDAPLVEPPAQFARALPA